METTTSGADAEVVVNNPSPVAAQKQSADTPHRRTPPKKQKRTTPSEKSKSGNSGRETSEIWNHFSKFTAKGGRVARRWFGEFVILDEQPFRVVEGEGFKKLIAKALPNFELPSRVTVARHCLRIYHEEKAKIKNLIKNQRVCLTSDTWTSLQNLTYMVVSAHWIDDQWNLQKKILNFFPTPDHKGETIAKGIEACLFGWGIENLFTVTLDNASANDATIKHLKLRIDDWKGAILGNEFLHVRCNAHILNLIVKDGLDEQIDPITRVRNAVKYVRSSPSRFASFKSFVEKAKIDTHGLELFLRMETTTSGADAEVVVNNPSPVAAQKQSADTPHRRTPPKKQKRTTPSEKSKSGNSGRETSEIWNHFSKFTAKGGKCRAKCNYCPKTFAAGRKNGTTTLWSHLTSTCHKSPFRAIDKRQSTLKPIKEGWLEGGLANL
ncbi:PREDICTED: zinc finger BED domain-containing protein DAYSLEEPER-like [Nicotiana attenuata]|uniref:zinc finger BED domain-containing protein DAYSLEEPER-like n=1 Tax=Nicotiana attenuata TaxID=49451 RepID=UPI0009058986|nr:PREDICTED: zinc finger BED domain-containing protein DAYSLEEPER-like [Nicotiana attenuata]